MKKVLCFIGVLVLMLSMIGCSSADPIDWSVLMLGDKIPMPESTVGTVSSNMDDYLSFHLENRSESDFHAYIKQCEDAGYIIEKTASTTYFKAYNDEGYELNISYYSSSEEISVILDAPMEMSEYRWPNNELTSFLPRPKSTIGKISLENEEMFAVYIGDMSIEDYEKYVDECLNRGFNVEYSRNEKSFSGKNGEGYQLSVNREDYKVIYLSIKAPENDRTVPSSSSEYEGANYQSVLSELETAGFVNIKTNVIYDLLLGFLVEDGEVENVSIGGNLTFEGGDVYDKEIEIIVTYHTYTSNDPENVTENNEPASGETGESKITMTMGQNDLKGMSYHEAERLFREMGFTKFKYQTVKTENESATDTICYIEITEWIFGDSNFNIGDEFDADSTVTFFSYKYEEPATPSAVFYSSNDRETAKKGNTGVFSYRYRGSSYDIYWIIDFDEGYVYNFTEGNGDSSCDKVKIVSGTLNDAVTITYHDGVDVWSYRLHFRYVGSPVTLILVDNDGFDYQYDATDLDDALELKDTKTIHEY